jgi:ATP phosphoribosyltransferase regulatory subunit
MSERRAGKKTARADVQGAALGLAPPSGMRDLLPPDAAARAHLRKLINETFALYGYDQVVTPAFELAEVIERGLETVDRRDLLRFVEPDTGDVALLRPDITPQIARIVATSLARRPAPYRISYEGTVFRRRRGRARKQKQVWQSGVELIGLPGPDADVEVVEVAARALARVGLPSFRVELAHVAIASEALEPVPESVREETVTALAHKDVYALEAVLAKASVTKKDRAALTRIAGAFGEPDVLRAAAKILTSKRATKSLGELRAVIERLEDAGLGEHLGVDLGELRGQAYYTGVSFTLLADGPGEPVGGGGRYDRLLERFGTPLPATGFALDVDHLEWALTAANAAVPAPRATRVLLGTLDPRRDARVSAELRALSLPVARVATQDSREALAYASSWGYDCVLLAGPKGLRALRVADGATRTFTTLDARSFAAIAAFARNES